MDEIIRFMFTSSDDGNTFFSRRGQQKLKVNIGVDKGSVVYGPYKAVNYTGGICKALN